MEQITKKSHLFNISLTKLFIIRNMLTRKQLQRGMLPLGMTQFQDLVHFNDDVTAFQVQALVPLYNDAFRVHSDEVKQLRRQVWYMSFRQEEQTSIQREFLLGSKHLLIIQAEKQYLLKSCYQVLPKPKGRDQPRDLPQKIMSSKRQVGRDGYGYYFTDTDMDTDTV